MKEDGEMIVLLLIVAALIGMGLGEYYWRVRCGRHKKGGAVKCR